MLLKNPPPKGLLAVVLENGSGAVLGVGAVAGGSLPKENPPPKGSLVGAGAGVDAAGAGEAFGSTIASEPPLAAVATIDVVGSGKQGAVFVYSLGGSGPTWSLTHTITPPPALAVRYAAWVCRWRKFVHSRACIVTHDLLRGAVRGCSDASAGVWSVVGFR